LADEILNAAGYWGGPLTPERNITAGGNIRYGASEGVPLGDTTLALSVREFFDGAVDTPFFLGAGIFRPHEDWVVPQAFIDLYDPQTLPIPDFVDAEERSEFARALAETVPHAFVLDDGAWPALIQHYLASVTYADYILGVILQALEDSPHADTTNVVVTSDHGFHLGDGEEWRKFTLYEQSARAPLIIHQAGQTEGQVITTPVNLSSIYATTLEMAGLDVPDVDGRSLVPLIAGEPWEDPTALTWMRGSYSLRTEDYRYSRYEDGSEELWDVEADPFQQNNLVDDPAFADLLAELRAKALDAVGLSLAESAGEDLLVVPEGGGAAGGAGDDVYIIETGAEFIFELPDGGEDTLIYTGTTTPVGGAITLPRNVENFTVDFFGPSLTLIGNALDNTINGARRDDRIEGLEGDDTLYGSYGDDVILGGEGNDQLRGGYQQDVLSGEAGDDVLLGGPGFDTLIGGEGDDYFDGGTSRDSILGQAGDDTIVGGQASDILSGGAGADLFIMGAGSGRDIVVDFTPGEDSIAFTAITQAEFGVLERDYGSIVGTASAYVILIGVAKTELSLSDFDFA
ncbi:MAG: sulfatase-like hydrolase/transferase, partial [Pseudomonadota bacterium]